MMNKKFNNLLSAIILLAYTLVSSCILGKSLEKNRFGDFQTWLLSEVQIMDTISIVQDTALFKKNIALDEVNIFRKFSPLKLNAGKLSYQVSKSVFATTGNALQLLQKMPGIAVLANGNISLNGLQGVQVLIDGKTHFMTGENLISYLSALPASSLDVIELITQPDASLDASGAARIINLKRNNKHSDGMRISVASNNEHGKYNRMYHNIVVETNIKKVNFSNIYSYAMGKDLVDVTSTRYLREVGLTPHKDLQLDMDAIREKDYRNHYYNAALDFKPNETINTGTYFMLNSNKRVKDEVVNSEFFYNHLLPDSTLITRNILHQNFNNFSTGIHIIAHFKGDSKWENHFDRQLFKQSDQQTQWSDKFHEHNLESIKKELKGDTKGRVGITTLQSKFQINFHPDIATTFGGKHTTIDMQTNSFYHEFKDREWYKNENLSNTFVHTEKLNALFVQAQYNRSDVILLDMGLRYEDVSFNSLAAGEFESKNVQMRSYKNFFPNISLTYNMLNQQKLALNYNRRVNRPNFRDLNPFVEINDPYLYEKGNPSLMPEYINNMELTWILKNTYSFQFSYNMLQHPISKSYNLDMYKRLIVTPMNLEDASSFGLRFNATSFSVMQNWNIQPNFSLLYKNYQWLSGNKIQQNNRMTPSVQLQNQVKLPLKINLEINCFANGSTVDGQANISHLWSVNTGIRKNFFQDKFTLYIYANDLCRSNRPKITFKGEGMNGKYQESYDSRSWGFNLSYRLSKGEKKNLKTNSTGNRLEENNRISY